MENETNTGGVAWVALIIAVIALILAWSAFNRAGKDVVPTMVDGVEEVGEEIEDTAREGTAEVLDEVSEAAADGAADARTDDDGRSN